VEDLRQKIKWTFDNPALARQMGLAAQKVAEHRFPPEKYWEELQKLHHELNK
jgi:glycosyltransferase involved in cell wall biosynthesis